MEFSFQIAVVCHVTSGATFFPTPIMPVLHAHELNSKGVLMIKLFNVALLPYDAARLPDDSWLEIMLTCTPRELLAMQLVSHRFYRILASNPHSWPQARNNLDPPVPPPPKDIEAAGVWTEAAYAQFIFGGRDCVVKSCKRWTTNFPLSFGLRIRVCSVSFSLLPRHSALNRSRITARTRLPATTTKSLAK
ncbi:hypothetical protein C8F01DRAFT_33920 [Mycena amicta]|nr:hypothetical protein C8F01DRAFT_33920 [Mycena amicta]